MPPSGIIRLIHALNPIDIIADLWKQRFLIVQFTRREIEGRYRGSFLGIIWSLVTPLLLLAVYTFVYGIVFKARWPGNTGDMSLAGFAVAMFAGQIAFQLFAEPVRNAPALIVANPNYVKRVVFPLPILAVAQVGAALFHFSISFFICMLAALWVHGSLPWAVLAFPLLMLPLALAALGWTWFLSSLGVFLRDIGYLVAIVLQVLFFVTPIFYPVEAVPEPWRAGLECNPLTPAIELVRCCLIAGPFPSTLAIVATAVGSFVWAICGAAWFRLTCKGFADVL